MQYKRVLIGWVIILTVIAFVWVWDQYWPYK